MKISDVWEWVNIAVTLKDALKELKRVVSQQRKQIDELGRQNLLIAQALRNRDRQIAELSARLNRLESHAMLSGTLAARLTSAHATTASTHAAGELRSQTIDSDGAT